ncbi:MAG: ABC transporter substrate-binding protein [Acidobacteria bacterium]|nr:ABC transporter substrate-binding protein [Acidobacteriota bacterium]
MNRTPREQSVDFELRRADVVELSATEFRRATQAGRTVTSSLPKQLIALRIAEQVDPVVRRALALSIDRASMHSVLLQRQGEVAASLLPQWLSGYAFVFPAAPDAARARQMLASARLAPVTVFADPGDTILKSIADRIAVNARDVGITVRVVTTQAPAADARMERVAIDTPSPALALAQFTLAPPEGDAQSIYAAESRLLETNLVIPLFHLPQSWLWSPRIRVWLRPAEGRDGALNLAGAWILEERNRP